MTTATNPCDSLSIRRYYLLLLAIIGLGMIARIYHGHWAVGGGDNQRWIIAAREVGNPLGTVPPVYYMRGVSSLVLYWWGALFGLRLESTAVLMFLLAAATIFLVAQSGRFVFGSWTGLFAAAFYALHPVNVVQDTTTGPDGLANAVLAAYLLLFICYLHRQRLIYLALSALLVGVCIQIKVYYILGALPLGACLLVDLRRSGRRWFVPTAVFAGALLIGVSVDAVLAYWQFGEPLGRLGGSDYAQRLAIRDGPPRHEGFEHVARATMERFRYINWLLFSYGFGPSMLTAWGIAWLLAKGRRVEHLAFGALMATWLAFLMFTPVAFRPLRYVEMQPRYLMILMPMLAVCSGAALAALLASLPERRLRVAFAAVVAVGFAGAMAVPNDYANPAFRRGRAQEFVGIRHVLTRAPADGVSELIFDHTYLEIIPDGYHEYGVTLTFVETETAEDAAAVHRQLREDARRALFVPRERWYWPLRHALRRGEYSARHEIPEQYRTLVDELEANGCRAQPVRVPDTISKKWLAAFGLIPHEQQLIGWVYRCAQPQGP